VHNQPTPQKEMKVTTARANGFAVLGNRSPRYFGIELFMSQCFFNKTSHCKHGKPTPDPRIKGFDRKTQNEMRDKLNEAALRFGFTLQDSDREWMEIVKIATRAATDTVKEKTDAGRTIASPVTKEIGGKAIRDAFKAACKTAIGLVHEREYDRDSWECADSQIFFSLSDMRHKRDVRLGLRKRVLDEEKSTCKCCGRMPPEVKVEVDHIVPLSKGGDNSRKNLQVLCLECNRGKGGNLEVNPVRPNS
jgi:hypothetical protein